MLKRYKMWKTMRKIAKWRKEASKDPIAKYLYNAFIERGYTGV